ncbi:MAG: hypothetical protein IJN68_05280 [Clostridia bacterium]|nr:hypothetical protein [Clostridia bacterium]
MNNLKEFWNSIEESTRKGICIALVVILVFASGNFVGSLTKITANGTIPVFNAAASVDRTTQTPAVNTVATTAPVQTTAPAADQPQTTAPAAPSTGAYTTTEEILALFNEAANKIKTDATKITKNFEMRDYDAEQSVVPSALNSLASSLMDQYLGDDTDPIEYATKDDIIANYQVPGQAYSSQLTAADVASATCVDNGSEYEVTLNLNSSVNPVTGTGVGAVCDVIEADQITSNGAVSAILKEFTITYSGCVVKCKIDKETKHVTWANYLTPLVIDALVSVVVTTVDAKVVLSFEKDYTINY